MEPTIQRRVSDLRVRVGRGSHVHEVQLAGFVLEQSLMIVIDAERRKIADRFLAALGTSLRQRNDLQRQARTPRRAICRQVPVLCYEPVPNERSPERTQYFLVSLNLVPRGKAGSLYRSQKLNDSERRGRDSNPRMTVLQTVA